MNLSDWTETLPPEVLERVCEKAGYSLQRSVIEKPTSPPIHIKMGALLDRGEPRCRPKVVWSGNENLTIPQHAAAALAFGGLVVLANDRVSPGMEPDLRHGFRVCDKNDDTIGEADTLPAAVLAALRRVYS